MMNNGMIEISKEVIYLYENNKRTQYKYGQVIDSLPNSRNFNILIICK